MFATGEAGELGDGESEWNEDIKHVSLQFYSNTEMLPFNKMPVLNTSLKKYIDV